MNNKKKILVTGVAGFIGYHFVKKLLNLNYEVCGIDSINNYYSVKLKKNRLKNLFNLNKNFYFYKVNISNKKILRKIFNDFRPDIVVNLAAQAGVRDSLKYPEKYLKFNIIGFLNILELSKEFELDKLVYASTSSVYGLNKKLPYKVSDPVDHPKQFYAVTKRTNELMAHSWSNLYNVKTIGLRFFTVYGPWGRPDMALYNFVDNISRNIPIKLYNYGNHFRDFTYIDDIVEGIYLSMLYNMKKLNKNQITTDVSSKPFTLFNLGSGRKTSLKKFVKLIEFNLGKKAQIELLPIQLGDVVGTTANINKTKLELGYNPSTIPEEGIKKFIDWYKFYKKLDY